MTFFLGQGGVCHGRGSPNLFSEPNVDLGVLITNYGPALRANEGLEMLVYSRGSAHQSPPPISWAISSSVARS
jgi:hypothetical protein